mgnify:CR=1 FL=1
MKIYFCGAHSSGKSTLTRYVSEKYKLPIITEAARMILSERELNIDSLRYNMDLVDDYQTNVFNRQLEEENKKQSFVSDRSFDCLAYSCQHSNTFSTLLNSKEFKEYLKVLKDPNSIIFFVRPSKATIKQDGVRETINWDGIVAIDAMVKMLLEMHNLRYFQISVDNMQERVRLIDSVLSLCNISTK